MIIMQKCSDDQLMSYDEDVMPDALAGLASISTCII
jgi:hypothetical protein